MYKAVSGMTSVIVFDANDTQRETENKWEKWWKDNQRVDQNGSSAEALAVLPDE